MARRVLVLVGAALVGAVFAAGLFVSGRLGGALLLVTAVILGALTSATWTRRRPQGRPLRIVIIAVIVVLAVVKLIHG
jgi:uncharacterized membrane protein YfcA